MPTIAAVVLSLAVTGAPADPVCKAARQLAAAQASYGAAPLERDTWSWQQGGGRAAVNAAGFVALALTLSSDRCGAQAAALRYADALVDATAAGAFLFDADIESLVRAGLATRSARYLAAANAAFAAKYGGATGQELVARIAWLRRAQPSLLGYEVASTIRAALAVGDRAKAQELAGAVLALPWDAGQDVNGWLASSRGALLEALVRLDPAGYQAAIGRLAAELLAAQDADGSWAFHATQPTAYAVRGLAAFGARAAAAQGRAWLLRTQLPGGAWATFNDGLPPPFAGEVVHEVTAEALLALR